PPLAAAGRPVTESAARRAGQRSSAPAASDAYNGKGTAMQIRTLLAWLLGLVALSVSPVGAAQSPPTITKSFNSHPVPVHRPVTLTFTITNPNPATDLTNAAFNDNLPAGLIIANPDSLVLDPVLGNCDPSGTTGTISPATTSISLSGGQIPANA